MKQRIIILLFLIISIISIGADETNSSLKRFGLFIGANDGGPDRVLLRYAESDAKALAGVMGEIGGIDKTNEIILVDPDLKELGTAFEKMRNDISNARETARKVEFVLYYSGHSDETGILLGKEKLQYKELKNNIEGMDADINIAILDSCSSGAFTRLKGGSMQSPFLVDESADMTGHAYLTSSSEDEAAQESDLIKASFFTHFLVSALRGAADSSQDGKVSLNEAYSFAFNETLARTENTQAGAQNPSYQFDLTGSGELVLTDLRTTEASITIDETISGRLYVRDESGRLITEMRKTGGVPVTLSLPSGTYSVTLDMDADLEETEIVLRRGANAAIDRNNFTAVKREPTRARGDNPAMEDEDFTELSSFDKFIEETIGETVKRAIDTAVNVREQQKSNGTIHRNIGFSLFPDGRGPAEIRSISLNFIGSSYRINGFEAGFINMISEDVYGFQAAALMNMINGKLTGFQAASILNIAGEAANAGQAAGIFNITGGNSLVQLAGVFNISEGSSGAAQAAGVFNIADKNIYGFQGAGVFNLANKNVYGFQGAGVFNICNDLAGVQAGVLNIAEDIRGGQLGLINIGKDVEGTQIGLININDDISGIPVGIINISKNGLHNMSLWYNEEGMVNIGFQLGSRLIYSFIYGGVPYDQPDKKLSFGLGMGLHLAGESVYFDADFSAKRIVTGENLNDITEKILFQPGISLPGYMIPSFRVSCGIELFGSVSFFGGLELDTYIPGVTSEKVTDYLREPWVIELADPQALINLYPSWFIGLRI